MLIDLGAQVDATNKEGLTPLACAAEKGALDVCNLLLDQNSRLDSMDESQVRLSDVTFYKKPASRLSAPRLIRMNTNLIFSFSS